MHYLHFLFAASRPRFWFYVFGPYLIGLAAGAGSQRDIFSWPSAVFAIYFLFPANLLIYGVNDIFDYETDILNEKKKGYELTVSPDRHRSLALWIGALNLPFLIACVILFPLALFPFLGFLFFSVFYSAPPFRAKAIPFVDSAFNILYVFPGAFGYQVLSGKSPPAAIFTAAALWTAGMHAYSAIPDADADLKAGIKTIATVCGPYVTLAVCGCLFVSAAVLSSDYLGMPSVSLGSIYLILMLASIRSVKTGRLFKLYRAFPFINVLAGFLLFWAIVLQKFL